MASRVPPRTSPDCSAWSELKADHACCLSRSPFSKKALALCFPNPKEENSIRVSKALPATSVCVWSVRRRVQPPLGSPPPPQADQRTCRSVGRGHLAITFVDTPRPQLSCCPFWFGEPREFRLPKCSRVSTQSSTDRHMRDVEERAGAANLDDVSAASQKDICFELL